MADLLNLLVGVDLRGHLQTLSSVCVQCQT